MRLFQIILGFVFLPFWSFAQEEVENQCDEIYSIVESMPEYEGGHKALKQFVDELTFPDGCAKNQVTYYELLIDKSGQVIKADVKGIDPDCASKINVQFLQMQYWQPGNQRGRAVCVQLNLKSSNLLHVAR